MNVLLKLDYKGHKAGDLLKDVSAADAGAIVRLGLGEILVDEPSKAEAKAAEKAKVTE